MKSKHSEWFEVGVKYDKTGDSGAVTSVKESYTIEAFSFADAEESIAEELKVYISGEFEVSDIKKAQYKEIFFSENPSDDRWYKVKAQFIVIDEKTEKEKRSSVLYLVQSNNLQNSIKAICEDLEKGMQDWIIASVAETKLLDVFEKSVEQ